MVNLSSVLDAETDAAAEAAVSAARTEGEGGASRAVPGTVEDEGEGETIELSEEMVSVVSHFQTQDWLKAMRMMQEANNTSVSKALEAVGARMLEQIREASLTQYATTTTATSPTREDAGASPPPSNKQRLQFLAKSTPMRLIWEERELLRLLESTMYISDYTSAIDIYHHKNKNKQMVKQIRHVCSILTGLVMAREYEEGQRMLRDRDFKSLDNFFATVFEIGRRYKINNPDRMRDSYGQLMYFLMDANSKTFRDILGFVSVIPIKTVHDFLAMKTGGLELLTDPLLIIATAEIYETDRRAQELASNRKQAAVKQLVAKYAKGSSPSVTEGARRGIMSYFGWSAQSGPNESADRLGQPTDCWCEGDLTEDDVELAIYSLADHMTFLRQAERPVERLYIYLTELFDPTHPKDEFTLGIRAGVNGARLTHDHTRQYQYVRQTLLLWKEILRNFLKLWLLADADLLSSKNPYHLRNTGQGLNRVQNSPRVSEAFASVVRGAQQLAGGWVGSSAVHLGDSNVPNALMFIDKYNQVPRIVAPIVNVLDQIVPLARSNQGVKNMIDETFGSPLRLQKYILTDFFRYAFDGSGADNFFDAGSCIDGRLTSAWNWCSQIEKKPYYHIFLMCGFVGFDGKF